MEGDDRSARSSESQVLKVNAVLIAGSIASTLVVALRCYTRTRLLRSFGYEDVFILLAQSMTIGSAMTIGLESHWGLGRHSWVQDPAEYLPYMKAFYASIPIYAMGMCLLKIAILLQYRRIFAVPLMQKLTSGILVFEGCWAVTVTFLQVLICIPVASFWDSSIEGRCINNLVVWYLNASINIVTDFLVFSLPLPVIHKLQLRPMQKVMLTGIFCLGFFTCIISILRLRTLSSAFDSDDATWDNVDAAIWSFLELSIGVVVSCLPTLRPLLVRFTPRIFGSVTPPEKRTGSGGVIRTGATGSSQHPYLSRSRATELRSSRTWKQTTQTRTHVAKDSDSTNELFDGGSSGTRTSSSGGGGGVRLADDKVSLDMEELRGGYNVQVTSGRPPPPSVWGGGRPSRSSEERRLDLGGITATTQITQQVEMAGPV